MLRLLLLNNWKVFAVVALVAAAVSASVTGVLAYKLHEGSKARWELKKERALEAQKKTLNEACTKDKQITTEASHGYQNQLADLHDELARVKRVQPNRCIPTLARSAAGRDATSTHQELPRADGIFTDDLYDFAADAEQVGRQLDACQGFIKAVWSR